MGATTGAWPHCPQPRPDARLRLVACPLHSSSSRSPRPCRVMCDRPCCGAPTRPSAGSASTSTSCRTRPRRLARYRRFDDPGGLKWKSMSCWPVSVTRRYPMRRADPALLADLARVGDIPMLIERPGDREFLHEVASALVGESFGPRDACRPRASIVSLYGAGSTNHHDRSRR